MTEAFIRRPCDTVLCDLDGVIRFFDHAEVIRLERDAGLPEGSTAAVAFGPENGTDLILGKITKKQWADSIARGLAERIPEVDARALADAFTTTPAWADPIPVALLREAREHCTVVLVTNATTWLDDDLARLGIADLADDVVNSARVGCAKPDVRIYEIAAERARATPDRCLFVDDREANVETATRLGMAGVHYRESTDLREALLRFCPTAASS
ncbi:putative hydrolase of the HAD superfamily [Streptomyces sp. WMMB 714]|jgi:putative hydrolase of the HAD superfamily|uniref:HAD family hydrolase n=1 Tax=Streptomyces sp. WMMB 714 TaxID=1286822 RepID=UPI0005F7C956|nr:HAD-IA family hydrolase [Streptomyces sp. WMMB 714]SCK39199.1 putative hydrolase of the HAD superfamily [Streptomyces sp. WMMB 714]